MRTPLYRWLVVFMLWFVCFFNYADRQAISAVLPELEREFHYTKAEQGLISSAFMWVYAAGAPFAGLVADRVRRKDLILGGCLFWSFVTVATGWCRELWHFVGVRALEGFGETFYFPATMSLVSDYHDGRTRSRALALHQSSVYAGTIAGSALGAWIAARYGWRNAFYAFGGAGMLLAVALYGWLREPRRGAADAAPAESLPLRRVLPAVFRSPRAVVLMLAFVGANFVATIFLTWAPTFLKLKFDFPLAKAGLYATLFIQLASAAGAPLGGWLADLLAKRHPGGRMLVQASGLLAGSVFVVFVGMTTSVPTLLTTMALFGFCKGLYDSNIFASLYDVVEPRARATAAGLMNTVGWGGGALGPVLVGYLADHGRHADKAANMSEAIACGGVLYILAAGLLIAAALRSARRGQGS